MPLWHTKFYNIGKRTFSSGKKKLRKILFKNYWTARFYIYLFRSLPARHGTPLLIYQMGKVGSTTINKLLKTSQLNQPIYKIHVLSKDGIKNALQHYKQINKINKQFDWERAQHVFESEILRKEILKNSKTRNWRIITLTREPIARNISSFFSRIDLYFPDFQRKISSGLIPVNDIIDIFLKEFNHNRPLEWYDIELKNVFSIDVFSSEFYQPEGYKIYKKGNIDLLLIKLESLEKYAKKAFKEFLDIDIINIEDRNIGNQKYYSDIYKKFKESIILPEKYIDKLYSSKYAKHFYSAEEIQSFKMKWKR